ncbi:MAG: nucleotidyltransferase family protein [Clostridia bacterium]|nr:nucleotidyltransferase family protein [Clostridia bacterium]
MMMEKGNIQDALFALLRYEICGVALSDAEKAAIEPEMLQGLYGLSKAHDLVHLVGDALLKNGLVDKNSSAGQAFAKQLQMSVFRYEQLQYELKQLREVLEAAKVPFLPLKGSVLRAFYPEPWMRTSCDIDIYVRECDLEKAAAVIEEKLHYRNDGKTPHDIQMFSENGIHLELHFDLIEESVSPAIVNVLTGMWESTLPVKEGKYERKMTNEMFYFYHIAHTAKHFKIGGCGIRPFIDFWIMENKFALDREKMSELLVAGKMRAFAEHAKALCEAWLEGKEHTPLSLKMETYILQGGVYGNFENTVSMRSTKKGKIRYLLSRIFMPYKELKVRYPSLSKCPILYPFYLVRRWCNLIFVKGRAKNSIRELNLVVARNENVVELLKNLEL